MNIRLLAVAALFAISFACAARADPAAARVNGAPASADQPSKEAIELARRYFAALRLDERTESMIRTLIPQLMQEEQDRYENLTAAEKQAIVEATEEATAAWIPNYMGAMAIEYARILTTDELKALVAFYEGPIGRSVVAKEGSLAPIATRVMQQQLPQYRAMLQEQLCRKLDCTKLTPRPQAGPT